MPVDFLESSIKVHRNTKRPTHWRLMLQLFEVSLTWSKIAVAWQNEQVTERWTKRDHEQRNLPLFKVFTAWEMLEVDGGEGWWK